MMPFTSSSYGELTNSTTFTVEREGDASQLYSFDFSPDGKYAYLA